jgi:hypothetical protein
MNFDHWKEALAAEVSGRDYLRAYVRAATGARARQRAAALRRAGPPAGRNPGPPRPSVLIPKAPGYSATPAVADARSAFIPPRADALVRVQSSEEEIA